MEKKPFFSIGVPVYNTEKYMARCLDSIIGQSFSDFEVICVDDGGSDNSIPIVREYAAKDSRIKIVSKENGGLPAARNTAIYCAQGEYIYFLDSDDTICDDALQNAYNGIVANNYPDLLHTGFIRVLNGKETLVPVGKPDENYFEPQLTKDERWIKMWNDKLTPNQVMTKFIKMDFLRTSGVCFSTRLFAQEDSDFTFNICRKADTMAFCDFYAFRYFKNQENSMSTVWSYKSVASVFTRWHNFYYCDVNFYKLGDKYKAIIAENKKDFLRQIRKGIASMPFGRSDEEIEKLLVLLETYFEKDIRKLPSTNDPYRFLFPLYKIIGIRKTVKLLCFALKLGGRR